MLGEKMWRLILITIGTPLVIFFILDALNSLLDEECSVKKFNNYIIKRTTDEEKGGE